MRKRQKILSSGFSLIELMVAGALMIGLAMAAFQLISSTSKSAGDLESRLRHRDLLDDIRFLFSSNDLCLETLGGVRFSEDTEIPLALSRGQELRKGITLPAYGITIDRLYMKNVRRFGPVTRTLLRNNESLGSYSEETETMDLILDSSLMGSGRPLKSVTVSRIFVTQRRGALNESFCSGNHQVSQSSGAPDLKARGRDSGNSLSSPPPPPDKFLSSIANNRSSDDCPLETEELQAQLRRSKVVQGEVVRHTEPSGQTAEYFCEKGVLKILRRSAAPANIQ